MVNVDWEQLRVATRALDEIGDNEVNRIYDQLINVEADDENDPSKLRLLFTAAQSIMQAKAVQAEVAIEELVSVTAQFDEFKTKNSIPKSSLVSESPVSSKFDRDIERLRSELHEKERLLAHEKLENQRLSTRVEDGEREMHNLTRQNTQYKDELEEYRRQLEQQQRSFDEEQTSKMDQEERFREKNRQLNKLLVEVETLETSNADLESRVIELRDKLHDSTVQMDKTTTDYIRLKNLVSELERTIERLREENDLFRVQMDDLLAQQRSKEVADDEIIAAVNQQVDEWKAVLSDKEAKILRLQVDNQELRDSLLLHTKDSDKSTLDILTNAVQSRDNHIQTLKVQLEQATKDLDESTSILEKIKSTGISGDSSDWRLEQINVLQKRLADVEAKEADLIRRTNDAEMHAQEREAEITEVLSQIKRYESGEYGLLEAVQEIKDCKQQIRLRDIQIEELTLSGNRAEFIIVELREEYEDVCRRTGIPPKEVSNLDAGSRKEQDRALSEVLRREIDSLEEERIELKQEIRKLAQIVGHRSSSYGLSAEDARKLQEYAHKLADRNIRRTVDGVTGNDDLDSAIKTKSLFDDVVHQVKVLQLELEATRKNLSETKMNQSENSVISVSAEDRHLLNLLEMFRTKYVAVHPRDHPNLLMKMINAVESGKYQDDLTGSFTTDLMGDVVVDSVTKVTFKSVETQTNFSAGVDPTIVLNADSNKINNFLTSYEMGYEEHIEMQQNLFNETNRLIDEMKSRIEALTVRNEVLESEQNNIDLKQKEFDFLSASSDASTNVSHMLATAEVIEKNLLRKCSALMESDTQWRHICECLQNQILVRDCSALRRIKYLERFKEMACFKISTLQRAIDGTVPIDDYDDVIRHNRILDDKYRSLLQNVEFVASIKDSNENINFSKTNGSDNDALIKRNAFLEAELQSCLEKLQSLEALSNVDEETIQGKVSILELKELNERQRADHAVALFDAQKRTFDRLNQRNDELERKFSQITKLYGEQQSLEQQLREELIASVSKKEYDRVCLILDETEAKCLILKQEMSRLKEVAEVAQSQVDMLSHMRVARELEEATLRRQFLDLQSGSDEKAVVGKLVRQLIGLQISEAAERHKLDKINTRLQKIEALSLRLEQKCDEKCQTTYNVRNEARTREINMKRMIRSLQNKVFSSFESPCEKYVNDVMEIQNYKMKIKQDYEKIHQERNIVEVATLELQVQKEQIADLISTINDKDGKTQKILDWHQKISELRLKDMKASRELQRLTQQLEHSEQISRKQEDVISNLELIVERLRREQEEQLLSWESRESELERTVSRLEQTSDSNSVRIDADKTYLDPDATLPLAEQLKLAMDTIKTNRVQQLEHQDRCRDLENKLKGEKSRVSELEMTIRANNQAMEEMKIDFKSNIKSEQIVSNETSSSFLINEKKNFELTQGLKVSQALVDSLKTRLSQKEDTLSKYEELLRKARDDLAEMAENHRMETERVQFKDRTSSLEALTALKHNLRDRSKKQRAHDSSLFSEQITRMNELEDVAAQQDNVISTLTEKLKAAFKEIDRWQLKVEATAKEMLQEKEKVLEQHDVALKKCEIEAENYKKDALTKVKEISDLKSELDAKMEECERAPSTLAKVTLDKMKHQLASKDKHLQSLSKALTDLKSDLKAMAEENIAIRAGANNESSTQHSPQQLKIIQEKLDESVAEVARLKKSSRKNVDLFQFELSKTRDELEKQKMLSTQLQCDKQRSQATITALEAKVKRISRTEEQDLLEVESLKSKVNELQDELRQCQKLHQVAERPYDFDGGEDRAKLSKRTLALESWESCKRWQQTAAKLKSKLEDREAEVTRLEASVTTLKNHVTRLEKEKSLINLRLTEAETKWKSTQVGSMTNSTASYQELSRKCFDLQDEISELKKRSFIEKDVAIEELSFKNDSLTLKINDLDAKLKSLTSSSSPKKMSVALAEELQLLRRKESSFEDTILKLKSENFELRFQIEQAKAELPKYVDRVAHLEKLVDIIKTEKTVTNETPNSPRRLAVGVSGQNVAELEKAVNALKKLIVKMQKENTELKRQTQESGKMSRIFEEENSKLKSEVKELRDRIGSSQSRDAYERATAKIVSHNERLLQDLQKEVQANEALRIQLHKSKNEVDELKEALNVLTKKKQLTTQNQQRQRVSRLAPRR